MTEKFTKFWFKISKPEQCSECLHLYQSQDKRYWARCSLPNDGHTFHKIIHTDEFGNMTGTSGWGK